MDVVALKDGSIEIIGNHRDLVDIVRDKCGDDIAKKVEELNPVCYDELYTANAIIWAIHDTLENKGEDGTLIADQVDGIKNKFEELQDCISSCI